MINPMRFGPKLVVLRCRPIRPNTDSGRRLRLLSGSSSARLRASPAIDGADSESEAGTSGRLGMTRGVISDKWSMRVLWLCAIGSGFTLFMVAQERQLQNRQKMIAEGLLREGESGAETGEEA